MFGIRDLEAHFDKTQIEVNEVVFNLVKSKEMSGILALWIGADDSYHVYATPNFEGIPVAVSVFDTGWHEIGVREYDNEIYDFDEYVELVTKFIKEILDENVNM